MPRKYVIYHFGVVHLTAQTPDVVGTLIRGIKTERIVAERDYNWGFFEVDDLKVGAHDIVHGFLVKYKSVAQEEVANPDTHRILDEGIRNRVLAKARFFLEPTAGLITYRPVANHISDMAFRERFSQLIQAAFDSFFVKVEVEQLIERVDIFKAMKSLELISRVSVDLVPSNP
jgi:hypothetical protein